MPEQYIQANGIQLAYEQFGAADDPAILLIMGLGTQLIAWPLTLCEALAAQGFRVIRFDNRDIGLSEKMDKAKVPKIVPLVLRSKFNLPMKVPYTLHDMADDAIGLMDALDIERAHLVGASMGGMITQIIAANHGSRVLSLTSIMSTSGNPKLPQARRDIVSTMAKRSMGAKAPDLASSIAFWRQIGSPGYVPTDKELKTKILASYNRCNYPQGYGRHLAAIIATGSRVKLLKNITAPTLIIHGKDDPLVPVEGGIDTARHIQGSRLEIINGMGHDLPAELMPSFAAMIGEHALAAQAGADDSPQAMVS